MVLAHECSFLFHTRLSLEVAIKWYGLGNLKQPWAYSPAGPETLKPFTANPNLHHTSGSTKKRGPFNCVQQTGMLQRFESKRGTAR